jgi:hypothetical protein
MRGAIVAALSAAMIGAPLLLGGGSWAKLPAPSDAEKAAAAAKAAKAAEGAKKAAAELAKSQDMVAERYKKMHAAKAKSGAGMAMPMGAKK